MATTRRLHDWGVRLGTCALVLLMVLLAACGDGTATQAPASQTPAESVTGGQATTTTTTVPATTTTPPGGVTTPIAATRTGAVTTHTTRSSATPTRTAAATRATTTSAVSPVPPATAQAAWGPTLPRLTGGQIYVDPDGRFTITVPRDWRKVERPDVDVAFIAPGGRPPLGGIKLAPVPADVTIDMYDDSMDEFLSELFADYVPISREKVVVGAHHAYKRVFQSTVSGSRLQYARVYFVEGGSAHILTFASSPEDFPRVAPLLDQIAGSYTVGKGGAAGGPTPTIGAGVLRNWGPTLAPLPDGQVYTDPDGRFSFSVPPDWTMTDISDAAVAFSAGDKPPLVMVNLRDMEAAGTNLETLNLSVERDFRSRPGYALISLDRIVMDNHPAYKRVYKAASSDTETHLVQVYFIDRNTIHALTFACLREDFPQWTPIFDGIIGSYKVGP